MLIYIFVARDYYDSKIWMECLNCDKFAANNSKPSLMKKLLILTLVFVLSIPTIIGAESNLLPGVEKVSRTVAVNTPLKAITVSNGIIVNYTASNSANGAKCVIEGNPEDVDRVVVEAQGDNLKIYMRKSFREYCGGIVVTLTAKAFVSYSVSSAAIINVSSSLSAKNEFDIEGSSGGTLNFSGSLRSKNMSVDLSSGASLNLPNSVSISKEIEIETSSGAAVNISRLDCGSIEIDSSSGSVCNIAGKATDCEIDVSSGSVVDCSKLTVSGTYEIDASSGSIVKYRGGKAKVETSSGAMVHNH